VSHLLVATQAAAQAAAARIHSAADFAAVASQVSTDATTASHGGDLGCGAPGTGADPIAQDQQFLQATTTAPIGVVSPPVQVTGGYDVFIVTQRTLTPLTADLKSQIQAQLQQQAAQPLTAFFQNAAKSLKVAINPRYGHWDPAQLLIVSPTQPDPNKSGLPTPPATTPPSSIPLTPTTTPGP
jgi:parvulin-like peptidyl-prolyl isomerase